MSKRLVFRRSIETLRSTVSTLCDHIWNGRDRGLRGPHLWTIPVDSRRDFDCILMDAIDELDARRAAMRDAGEVRGISLPEWDDLEES